MSKKPMLVVVSLLISLGLLLSLTPGIAQTGSESRFPAELHQTANDILQSNAAKYLSGTGRNALEHITGRLPLPGAQAMEAGPPANVVPLVVPGFEVMVNNPAQDIFERFDISTQSETAVSGIGDNIVVAYNDSAEAAISNSFMGYSRSRNGGLTFTDLGRVPAPPTGFNFGDPGLVADRMGNFYASSIDSDGTRPAGFQFSVGVTKSTDGGQTFGNPVLLPPAGVPPNSFPDKPFIAVDTSGRATDGSVYVTFTNFASPSTQLPILFSRSTNGGATFSTPIQISSPTEFDQGSEPVVGANGEVYVAWERLFDRANPSAPSRIVVAKSTNGGLTFGPPVVVADVNDIGFFGGTMLGNFRVNSFPRIDVSPTNGNVYITYASNPRTGDSGDIFFTRSTNGGATWDPPTKLNDDSTTNDQWFPDIAVNGAGQIEVFWYDKRNDPGNLMIDLFEAVSTDDGASFGVNQQVNGVSFPPAVGYDPFVVGTYMGDYIDIKAETVPTSPGRGLGFLMAWGDNRRAIVTLGGTRNDQDVFFTRD